MKIPKFPRFTGNFWVAIWSDSPRFFEAHLSLDNISGRDMEGCFTVAFIH